MGNLPKFCDCTINNNQNNIVQNKQKMIPPKTSINLLDYDPNDFSPEENKILENVKKNYDNSIQDSSVIDYNFLTAEEIQEINDKMNYKYPQYKQIPLNSSDLNFIYRSGLIE